MVILWSSLTASSMMSHLPERTLISMSPDENEALPPDLHAPRERTCGPRAGLVHAMEELDGGMLLSPGAGRRGIEQDIDSPLAHRLSPGTASLMIPMTRSRTFGGGTMRSK